MSTAALLREQILAAHDLKREEVEVPEWGTTLWVRGMTSQERDEYESEIVQQRGRSTTYNLKNLRARLLTRALVDEDGTRLFSDKDVVALGGKNAAVMDRLFAIARRMSGIGEKDVEELAGNSGDPQGDDSPSV